MLTKYIDTYVVLQLLLIFAILLSPPFLRIELSIIGYGLGMIFMIAGIWLLILSVKQLGKALTPAVTPKKESELVTTGIYRVVRHPMYFAVIIFAIGWSIFWGSLLALSFTLLLIVFFAVKASKEEELLKKKYPEYSDYQTQVNKKIIPFIY